MLKILVLIPTANRSDLAERAARSALDQSCPDLIKVVVSDNSDERQEAELLGAAMRGIDDPRLDYVRPPSPLNMGDHWDWAIQHCLDQFAPTHLLILTDRMVYRGQAVAELAGFVARAPASVITFMHDRVNDAVAPVVLERSVHSDALCQLESGQLLRLSSRCFIHQSLPRLLNTLVPVSALQRVKAVFGDYCRALAPDFGFAYRYLATHENLLYYDKALTIHSGILRSNGASAMRGILSKDAIRFLATHRFAHVPYPEIFSLGNAILEEYCRVAATPSGLHLPPVNRRRYLKMLYSDAMALLDVPTRERLLALLRQRGHQRALLWLQIRRRFKERTQWIEKGGKHLIRTSKTPRAAAPTFMTVQEALAFDAREPLAPTAALKHLDLVNPKTLQSGAGP